MTRKDLTRTVSKCVKSLYKVYGYKVKSDILYRIESGFFIAVSLVGTGKENNLLRIRAEIKPLYFDDIFWDVFQMHSNKTEPLSLRAVGSFAVKGLEFYREDSCVESELEILCKAEHMLDVCEDKIHATICQLTIGAQSFIDYARSIESVGMYDIALGEMLYYINSKDYDHAFKIACSEIEAHRCGHLQNKGKDIYQHIIEYCQKYI